MKKLIVFTILLANYSLFASVNCLDNSTHLKEDIDYHEMHPIACDCPCQLIKNNRCTECGHLQNAATYIVVQPVKMAQQNRKYPSYDPQKKLRQLAFDYLQKKK